MTPNSTARYPSLLSSRRFVVRGRLGSHDGRYDFGPKPRPSVGVSCQRGRSFAAYPLHRKAEARDRLMRVLLDTEALLLRSHPQTQGIYQNPPMSQSEILIGRDADGNPWLVRDNVPGSGGGTTLLGYDEHGIPIGRKLEDWPDLIVRWDTPEAHRA